MKRISFITTCKARLHHLKQTLPKIMAQSPDEMIVVDYGCPEKAGDWVEANFPSVKVVRVFDDPGFCVARARNLGSLHASSPWLCFIDADILVAEGWVDWMRENLNPACFYRADLINGKRDVETWGTVICLKAHFDVLEGYDEAHRGWGGEDNDLYARLLIAGVNEAAYPSRFVSAIHHDDAERVTYHDVKVKAHQLGINIIYRKIKREVELLTQSKTLPFRWRELLMAELKKEAARSWSLNSSVKGPFGPLLVDMSSLCEDGRFRGSVLHVKRGRRRYLICGPADIEVRLIKSPAK